MNVLEYFDQYQNAPVSSPLYQNAMRFYQAGQFEYDAIHDRLPTVSWIIPTSYQSEHPDFMPAAGADFVASKLNAIAANPDVWAKTVFILIYDENDGLFDHVTPPTAPAGTPGEYITVSDGEGRPRPDRPRLPGAVHHRLARGRWAATSATTPSTTPRSSGCSSW
jgi:phospholipase C